MGVLRIFFFTMGLMMGVGPVAARDVVIPIPPSIDLDDAGKSLRQALNAYEASMLDDRPVNWTRAMLFSGDTLRVGPDDRMLLLDPQGRAVRVMLVNRQGPIIESLSVGREVLLGDYRVILLSSSTSGRSAEILVKAENAGEVLRAQPLERSQVRIEGTEIPRQLVVTSADGRLLNFSREFLRHFNQGMSAETAAQIAKDRFPPVISAARGNYTDPVNFGISDDLDLPFAAGVTFTLVRADRETLNALSSELAFDSAGRDTRDPRVQGRTGPDGTEVILGNPGDRFRARLRLLEREGRVNVDGETFVRVPFDGQTIFEIQSNRDALSAIVSARLLGRNAVNLSIDNSQSDTGLFGSLRTNARLRDGQTVQLARTTNTRTETQESQVPILGDLPWLGPIFGTSSRRVNFTDYALFATLRLE